MEKFGIIIMVLGITAFLIAMIGLVVMMGIYIGGVVGVLMSIIIIAPILALVGIAIATTS